MSCGKVGAMIDQVKSLWLSVAVMMVASCGGASPLGNDATTDADPDNPDGATSGDSNPTTPDADWQPIATDAKLYTSDGTMYAVTEVGAAIDHALLNQADNVILYVHGRACGGGGEPMKSLGDAIPKMEAGYSAAVVMLVWPGADDGCPLGFPEAKARASGGGITQTLRSFAAYKAQGHGAGVKFTFITHSMGSLVMEASALAHGTDGLPANLFDNIIINSGASAAADHAMWAKTLTFAPVAFITVNDGDNVLRAAGNGRLGRSVDGATLTSRITYVDFTANNVNHAYYLPGGQKGAGMKAFYQTIMNGLPFSFTGAAGVGTHEQRNGATIYHFNGQ